MCIGAITLPRNIWWIATARLSKHSAIGWTALADLRQPHNRAHVAPLFALLLQISLNKADRSGSGCSHCAILEFKRKMMLSRDIIAKHACLQSKSPETVLRH
jgi:hypothetical protein